LALKALTGSLILIYYVDVSIVLSLCYSVEVDFPNVLLELDLELELELVLA